MKGLTEGLNMNNTTFVTAFSADGYRHYGHRLVETFKKHNPGFKLIVYVTDYLGGGNSYMDLEISTTLEIRHQELIPELTDFLNFYKGDSIIAGKKDCGKWNDKEKRAGYSYRYDAYKFCRMVYVMQHAAHHCDTNHLIWLDGDNVVRGAIPDDIATKSLAGSGGAIAYLGRGGKHTETGYLVFDLDKAIPIIDTWAGFYTSDNFIMQKEWHSAFLFDRAREANSDIKCHDMTPGGRGHVIHQCWVGKVFDHCKGNRKNSGRSPEARP